MYYYCCSDSLPLLKLFSSILSSLWNAITISIFDIEYENIFVRATDRTALLYILQPIGIHSYFHNSDSFIYTHYIANGYRQNIDMRYEGSTQPTYKMCYIQVVLPQSYSFLFSPSLASQKKDLSLLHIFYIACCISKKEFITEDIFCGYISVFISTTIATTRALIRVNETWNGG